MAVGVIDTDSVVQLLVEVDGISSHQEILADLQHGHSHDLVT